MAQWALGTTGGVGAGGVVTGGGVAGPDGHQGTEALPVGIGPGSVGPGSGAIARWPPHSLSPAQLGSVAMAPAAAAAAASAAGGRVGVFPGGTEAMSLSLLAPSTRNTAAVSVPLLSFFSLCLSAFKCVFVVVQCCVVFSTLPLQ